MHALRNKLVAQHDRQLGIYTVHCAKYGKYGYILCAFIMAICLENITTDISTYG